MILALTACFPDYSLYIRDISQAYVQSNTSLNRDFYTKPLPEIKDVLKLEEGTVLKVIKPLYSVPEVGNHWFKTYHQHYTKRLKIRESTYDLCLLYSDKNFGIVGIQTDDTLFLVDQAFTD